MEKVSFDDISKAVHDEEYERADAIAGAIYGNPEWDKKIEESEMIHGSNDGRFGGDVYYDSLETAVAVHIREVLERNAEEGESRFNSADAHGESFGVARHTTSDGETFWYVGEGRADNATWCGLEGLNDAEAWFEDEWDQTFMGEEKSREWIADRGFSSAWGEDMTLKEAVAGCVAGTYEDSGVLLDRGTVRECMLSMALSAYEHDGEITTNRAKALLDSGELDGDQERGLKRELKKLQRREASAEHDLAM
jgi:hypothetical protein